MAAQSIGDRVTVRGEVWEITNLNNCSHLGAKFFGKIAFDLRRVSDGATSRYVGKRVTAQCTLTVAEPEPVAERCDHSTGQSGCALPTCQGVPVGVDVTHAAEPVAGEPVAGEYGNASYARDMVAGMRRHGLSVSLPTVFASDYRPGVRWVQGCTFAANGHAVTVVDYESRGPLDRHPRMYAAVYVGGQLISSEQPLTGGAANIGHAIGYAVARHVETLPEPVAEPEPVAVAEVAEVAEPVAEVADFAGAVDLAEVPAEIGAEVPEVAAEPEPVAGGQRRGYGQTVTRTVTNRREGACDWCGVIVPAGRGEARLLDVGGWVTVHPDSRWQGSPVSGGYVGGCPAPQVAEPVAEVTEPVAEVTEPVADGVPAEPVAVAEPVADAAEVDRSAVADDMWLRARFAWDSGNLADVVTMIDAGETYAPAHPIPHHGTWSGMRAAVLADIESAYVPAEPETAEPVAEVSAEPVPVRTPLSATVDRDSLADALAFAGKSVPRRPSVPVLSGVMLSAEGGRVTVATFDYDSAREVDVPADDVTAGRVLIGYKSLADMVKTLPKRSRVTLAEVGAAVTVECGRVRSSLPTMPAEDYPTLPAMPDTVGALPVQVFADMVSPVALSAGTDETLPQLTGVRVEATGRTLAMMSTDRYRLGIRETGWAGEAFGAILPARMLAEVAKRYAKIKGGRVTVGCEVTGDGVRFGMVCDRYRVNVRTLDDGRDFPPVRSLVPAEGALIADATVDAADLLGAIGRAATACERTMPVRLTFTGAEVTVAGGGGDTAEVAEPVACDWSGGELTIAFNPAYLADGVKAAGTDRVRFRFVSHDRAALIVPAGEGVYGPGDLYLIMPIRGGIGSWTPPGTAEPVADVAEPVAEPAEVPAEVAEVAEPVAVEVPADAAALAEPEPGAEIMGRVLAAWEAGDLAAAVAAVAEGETVAPDYRAAGASGAVYGWAEVRAALPAEPVAPVAEPAPVAVVPDVTRVEVDGVCVAVTRRVDLTAGPVADVAEPAEVAAEPEPVAETAEPVAEVAPEPVSVAEPVTVPEVPAEPVAEVAPEPPVSVVDAHAAILAQLGRAGSLADRVPASPRVTVPHTAAEVVARWAADDMPVPVSPAPAPVAEPVAAAESAWPVPVWTYAAGMRVRSTLKDVRPEVARRMRAEGVKVGRVSIVPDRDARAVAVTLDGVAEGDAPRVWAIVAEVMAPHGFTPAEVGADA